jgi:DNA-binding phage protein
MANGSRILQRLHVLVKDLGTNPYQIAKATGVSLPSVQRMLARTTSPSFENLEAVLAGLGYEVKLVKSGKATVESGTGRGHGIPLEKRRRR